MSPFAEFLDGLFRNGRAVLRDRPRSEAYKDVDALELLKSIFAEYRLQIAGPDIDFDAGAAVAAAELLSHACWFLLSRDEPDAELERSIRLPGPPRSAAAHLSADLTLRFLPQVHHRARARDPADRLTKLLAEVLRGWPLSGVLSDVEAGPSVPTDFGSHPGLLLLYAERLAGNEKPSWIPQGQGWEFVELVYAELGKDLALLSRSALVPFDDGGTGVSVDD
jgi:hypothetical protein